MNFNKGAKETQWRKASLSTNGAGTIEVCMQKKKRKNLDLHIKINKGRDRLGAQDWHVHTAIFKIDNKQGPTVNK